MTLGRYCLNRIYIGDSYTLLKSVPDACIDLIYADMIFTDLNLSWLSDCARALKDTGSIYVHTNYRSAAQVKLYLDRLSLVFQNWIVWCYKSFPDRVSHYQRKHDDILFYTKSDVYTWNSPTQPPAKSTCKTFKTDEDGLILNPTPAMLARNHPAYVRPVVCRDWWDDISITYARWDTGGKRIHKWQKPEKLLERIIEASSNIGDVVLDPFGGSGTTAAVAKNLGRRWLLFEIDPQIVKIATKRINNTPISLLSFM